MDCAHCTHTVRDQLAAIPGVEAVEVLLSAGEAVVRLDPARVDRDALRAAVERAGFAVAAPRGTGDAGTPRAEASRRPAWVFGLLAGGALAAALAGEWLGIHDAVAARVPPAAWIAALALAGWPVARDAVRALRAGRVSPHALVGVGAAASAAVGEWPAALMVLLLMRVAAAVEAFTARSGREAIRALAALAPDTARVVDATGERDVPLAAVRAGDVVSVRPGERIPVDGEVVTGRALVDRSAVTGEVIPAETRPGAHVFAASIVHGGALRLRASGSAAESTFARMLRAVQGAEADRPDVHRVADRAAAWMLPVVVAAAIVSFLVTGRVTAAASVLVAACSCSIALAVPLAVTAAIAAGARRGVLVRGGRALEALARVDAILVDRTGTLTVGRPRVTRVTPLAGRTEDEVLELAAAAERDSEHPLAEAIRTAARARGLAPHAPSGFEALPGRGVRARVDGAEVRVGGASLVPGVAASALEEVERDGATAVLVARGGEPVGVIGVTDAARPEVPAALAELDALGMEFVEVVTGDASPAAGALAASLGLEHRGGILPEGKRSIVRAYQAQGFTVAMIGDGVNDAPALACAHVGIAMGPRASALAAETAGVVLMQDDWRLVPEAVRLARRARRVIHLNLAVVVAYNAVGITLAAAGLLSPVAAAALHLLPDLWVLATSSLLLRGVGPGRAATAPARRALRGLHGRPSRPRTVGVPAVAAST
jgi:Cd2+/Zn2+-exporting ATPase/Cu+-exporting ATPase